MKNGNTTEERTVILDRELFEYLDLLQQEQEDLEWEIHQHFGQIADEMREEW